MRDNFEQELKRLAKNSDIEVPDRLRKKVKDSCKKLGRKSILLSKVLPIVATFLIGILTFGVCFPTYAKELPGIKQVIEFLNRNNEIDGYVENSTPINKSIRCDGYTINIDGAFYDGDELSILYNVAGDEKLDIDSKYWFDFNVDINQKISYEYGLEYGELVDDNTYGGLITMFMKPHNNGKLPDVFKGKIDIKNLNIGMKDKSIEVESSPIEVVLDSREQIGKEFKVNKSVNYDGNTIKFTTGNETQSSISLIKKIERANGSTSINYVLWDSEKGQLRLIAGLPISELEFSDRHRLPGKESNLSIIPFVYLDDNSIKPEDNIIKHKVTLEINKYDFGSYGTFEIKNIKDEGEKTYITVKANSRMAMDYFYFNGDSKEEYYRPLYKENTKVLGDLEIETTYVFKKLDRSKNYYIETPKSEFKVLTDQIIRIEK